MNVFLSLNLFYNPNYPSVNVTGFSFILIKGCNSDDRLQEAHLPQILTKLNEHASKWREIGTFLGFRPGELNLIESKPLLLTGAPGSWLRELLAEWLQWAPGDVRGSAEYARLSSLKRAVDKAGLGRTASELTVGNLNP